MPKLDDYENPEPTGDPEFDKHMEKGRDALLRIQAIKEEQKRQKKLRVFPKDTDTILEEDL